METLIIGAGAMGCIFGAALTAGGHAVTFYDVDQNKVDTLNQNGLVITEPNGSQKTYPASAVFLIEDAPAPELAIILVKSYSTAQAARELSLVKKAKTQVLSLQNGLGHISTLAQYLDEKQIFPGVTYQAAYEIGPGQIHHSGNGPTTISPLIRNSHHRTPNSPRLLKNSLSKAMDLACLLNNCGIPAAASTDLKPIRWQKLIVNSAINPLSALHNLPNGELPKNPEIARDMMALVTEGVTVAQKDGVSLNYGEIWANVLETCRATAQNHSSMLSDVTRGRVTEIEAINGSIARLGEQYGVDTPINTCMVRGVVAIHGRNDQIRLNQ
ncbi:MAG: 2-dehydropantoate 2-reductase [Clostridiales bacterium]|nr:2-dehydropantoate 2-reductase [Clostridiales bacterium]